MFRSAEQLEKVALKWGCLPFFKNDIEGFSIEEMTPDDLWFSDEEDGPWEWKGPVISYGSLAYGKFFRGKAGFISLDLFPDWLNYRRAHAVLSPTEKELLHTLVERESLLSKELKALCGYATKKVSPQRLNPMERKMERDTRAVKKASRSQREGFETAITRLQMGGYVVVADFEYLYDRGGRRYGWGIARYTTPEALYGDDLLRGVTRSPMDSQERLFRHLQERLPHASDLQLLKMIG